MIGILSAIPFMIFIVVFVAIAIKITRTEGILIRLNRKSRQVNFILAGGFLTGTFPLMLGVINGLLFDLFPPDDYTGLVIDRFATIFGYIGILQLTFLQIFHILRYHVLYNISQRSSRVLGISLIAFLTMTTWPITTEAIQFTSKTIESNSQLFIISRYIILAGEIVVLLFTTWHFTFIAMEIYKFSKIKDVENRRELFQRIYFLLYLSLFFIFLIVFFFILSFTTTYRSKEYIVYIHLSGAFIGFASISCLQFAHRLGEVVVMIVEMKVVQSSVQPPVPLKKLVANSNTLPSSLKTKNNSNQPTVILSR